MKLFKKIELKREKKTSEKKSGKLTYLDKLAEKVCKILPDFITGEEGKFRMLLYKVYGEEMDATEVFKQKIYTSKLYLMVIFCFAILMVFTILNLYVNPNNIVFEKDGRQYVDRSIAGDMPKSVELRVKGSSKNEELNKEVAVTINPKGYIEKQKKKQEKDFKKSKKKKAFEELKMELYSIAGKDSKNFVALPKKAGSIDNLSWQGKKDRTYAVLMLLGLMFILIVFLGRYSKLKKIEKIANESVERELGEFFAKLVLLINAGMVFTSAFDKAIESGEAKGKENYFYSELKKIKRKMDETNSSAVTELKSFSKRTENKEFIRIVNVISENMERGTELVQAMETESALLSYQKKKRAEERAKIAETKLTFPLAMQLLSLILITLAPALLEM